MVPLAERSQGGVKKKNESTGKQKGIKSPGIRLRRGYPGTDSGAVRGIMSETQKKREAGESVYAFLTGLPW